MHDVIILGSGPAGFTAAIYTTRANLKTLIIAGNVWGGQLMLTTIVENYPGFPDGIQGPELMAAMRKQAEKHGAEIIGADFSEGDFSHRPFTIKTGEKTYEGKAVIISTGANTKWLDVPGEKVLIGRGVSSCAPCDAAFFRGKNVIVVGGGDTAMEEALYLTRFVENVIIIYRGDTLRASHIMQERVKNHPNITFLWNTVVTEIQGQDKVVGVRLKNIKTNEEKEMPLDGVFVAIGLVPNTAILKGIDLDEKGYVKVREHTKTNIDGVFVAGDVHDSHYKQAVTAAGFGCMAALEAERWLSEVE